MLTGVPSKFSNPYLDGAGEIRKDPTCASEQIATHALIPQLPRTSLPLSLQQLQQGLALGVVIEPRLES